MKDFFAAKKKKWNLLKRKNERISETFEVEKGQLKILIDFFCYDVIYNVMIDNIKYYPEDVNVSDIEEILEDQITNLVNMLNEMSINIQKKFDRLYWDCLIFGYNIKELQEDIYHIRKCLIEEMTENKFFKDPEVMYGTLYGILFSLKKIEKKAKACEIDKN